MSRCPVRGGPLAPAPTAGGTRGQCRQSDEPENRGPGQRRGAVAAGGHQRAQPGQLLVAPCGSVCLRLASNPSDTPLAVPPRWISRAMVFATTEGPMARRTCQLKNSASDTNSALSGRVLDERSSVTPSAASTPN